MRHPPFPPPRPAPTSALPLLAVASTQTNTHNPNHTPRCFSLDQNYNATAHIAAADKARYGASIRLFTATPAGAAAPQPQGLPDAPLQAWSAASASSVGAGGSGAAFSYFSATCWFAAKGMVDARTFGDGAFHASALPPFRARR